MPAATDQTKDVLTEVLSARVAPGFCDQVRAAARAEGVRPGAIIREAVQSRLQRSAEEQSRMAVQEWLATAKAAEGLAARADDDPEWKRFAEARIDAFRGHTHARIETAHRLLGQFLDQQRALDAALPSAGNSDLAAASFATLNAAFSEMQDALSLAEDLGRILTVGMES